jgi:hypothetical protein
MAIPATYAVHVYNERHAQIRAEVFQGSQAYSEAYDFLVKMKDWDRAQEIWFTRMDGGNPVWVMKPLKRDGQGQ